MDDSIDLDNLDDGDTSMTRDDDGKFAGADGSDDAPTAGVESEDVVAFLEELNAKIRDLPGGTSGFGTTAVTRDTAPSRRTAIDPANPPSMLGHAHIRIVDVYEECVETDNLPAAAALRRLDTLTDQKDLAGRIDQLVEGIEAEE